MHEQAKGTSLSAVDIQVIPAQNQNDSRGQVFLPAPTKLGSELGAEGLNPALTLWVCPESLWDACSTAWGWLHTHPTQAKSAIPAKKTGKHPPKGNSLHRRKPEKGNVPIHPQNCK